MKKLMREMKKYSSSLSLLLRMARGAALVKGLALLCFVSCVGEIQTSVKAVTESSPRGSESSISFGGISEAIGIADDKIEVYFSGATGGSKKFTYFIYVGNQPLPVSVSEEVLERDYRGLYRHTITGLDIGTEYVLKVDAKDIEDSTIYSTKTSISESTFSNHVADFSGVSSVRNTAGVDGVNSLEVRWGHASIPGGVFDHGDGPDTYEIILLEADKLSPAALDDDTLDEEDGRIVKTVPYSSTVTEATVRGLKEDTSYYVAVRCIHEDSIDDASNPKLRSEMNHRYIEAKTLSSDASNLEYDPDEFELRANSGELATTSLIASWGSFSGVFHHFRVYYALENNLNADTRFCNTGGNSELNAGQTLCKKTGNFDRSVTLGDLIPQVSYNASLVVCIDSLCTQSIFLPMSTASTTTNPGSVSLGSVSLASNLEQIGSVFLRYSAIDFSNGYFDGLGIQFTTDSNDLQAWLAGNGPKPTVYFIENSPSADHDLVYENFNYKTDTSIEVSGLNYSAEQTYCFTIFPFNYDSSMPGGKRYFSENSSWQCEVVQSSAPSTSQFTGFKSAKAINNLVELSWDQPSGGMYSHYEVFYRSAASASDTSFSFVQAARDTTVNYDYSTYQRVLLSADSGSGALTSFDLDGLANGFYILGLSTYYNAGVGKVKRSYDGSQLYMCSVTGSGTRVDCDEI